MIELFYDVLGLVFWLGTLGLVGWWVWSMRKAATPRRRTPREEAELAGLRAALDAERTLTPNEPPTRASDPGPTS